MTATISTSEEVTTRECGTCGKVKDVSQFYKDGKDYEGKVRYRRDCKECYRVTRLSNRRVKARATAPPKASTKKAGGKKR